MDKLKENGFAITVALLSIGLVAIFYFLILVPYLDVGAAESLTKAKEYLDGASLRPQYPTLKLVKKMESRQEQLQSALTSAKEFYDNKKNAFDVFYPGEVKETLLTDGNGFASKYQTWIAALKKSYTDTFPEATPTTEEAEEGKLGLEVLSAEVFTTPADVAKGMKTYWVIEEVFNAATKLQVGGIKKLEIKDPITSSGGGRKKDAVVEIPDHFGVIRALINLEMPMSKVNDLIGELQRSSKVPFLVRTVKSQRIESQLTKELIVVKDYADGEFPQEKADRDGHPGVEPNMAVFLEFWALDWKGLKEKKAPKRGGKKK